MIISTVKYTSTTDVVVTMLEAARHGGMKAYLSSPRLIACLELVIRNGLLAYDSAKQRYRTTEKGLRLLELYHNIGKLELDTSTWTMPEK
jgi:predicted transcriptional regulator